MATPKGPDSSPTGQEDEEQGVKVPGFRQGGRVDRTGIALVHEGEYILPSPGSEAAISAAAPSGGDQVINYYFPVSIEVVGTLTEEQLKQVTDTVFDALDSELASRT